jgi:hypothetical protein
MTEVSIDDSDVPPSPSFSEDPDEWILNKRRLAAAVRFALKVDS